MQRHQWRAWEAASTSNERRQARTRVAGRDASACSHAAIPKEAPGRGGGGEAEAGVLGAQGLARSVTVCCPSILTLSCTR